ncbi:MAG TPA: 2-isopropylmalate synthase [Burkholderiaceae bacterium]|nr:2-isopropylmalate synthase [Burkholderiaceae bacterium]
MLKDPSGKYRPTAHAPAYANPKRAWPSRTLSAPPVWLSTDLRDGNQALFEPMNAARKQRLFDLLLRVGFKEIEVGFPSASQTDFDFVRRLVDEHRIPPDVTPMVITQAREDLIRRTVASIAGARRAIVHLYNATAPAWRRVVFGLSIPEVMALVERHVRLLRDATAAYPRTQWVLQYSPETFSMTEPDVALAACHAAIGAWGCGAGREVIINLPTTVENATPNVFADQVEWMHQRLQPREHVIVSVHPHNDRGTGVAAAELAMLAGAQRVEGCLFGNGERSGNVDIVTLALNLYTQGIAPGLDFSDLNGIAREAEACTQLPIHPRHPYVGDLVYTAFSGSHQDAIRKGFAAQRDGEPWEVPYLPIDPADIGRTYDGVIRVNSQSGKGGIAYLLEREHGVVMPRRMLVEFSAVVQRQADASESEIAADALWRLFDATYLRPAGPLAFHGYRLLEGGPDQRIELDISIRGERRKLRGSGNGPIAAAVDALGIGLRIDGYEERAVGAGADAQALAIVESARDGVPGTRFGAAIHGNIVTASVMAVMNAAQRLLEVDVAAAA